MSDWVDSRLTSSLLAPFLDSSSALGEDRSARLAVAENFRISLNTKQQETENIAVVIEKWTGRFGNNVFQLLNGYLVARLFGAKTVIAPAHDFFESRQSEDVTFLFGNVEMNEMSVAITSTFFPLPFKNYYEFFGFNNVGGFYRDFKKNLNLNPFLDLTEQDLVLFVRSGDIFTLNDDSINGYGQPPLSFYEAVIETEKPERIFLLAEDDSSPLVNGLLSRKIPNLELVRLGMRGDFEYIFGAKKLAAGTSSLIPNMLNLSSQIRCCYSFEGSVGSFDGSFTNVIIRDEIGTYANQILKNNWRHSSEQLSLMMEYPRSHLKIPTDISGKT